MTAATLAVRDQPLVAPGSIIADVDLWCPGQRDPIGPDHINLAATPDPMRYVVWVDMGRGHGNLTRPELAPRKALHVNQVGRWST